MPPDLSERDEERAPLLGTWRRWYAVVLLTMGALVALFTWLSVHYR